MATQFAVPDVNAGRDTYFGLFFPTLRSAYVPLIAPISLRDAILVA